MAYDETLADRIRPIVGARSGVSERKMFGGITWMVGDHMAVGIMGDELMVRLDPEDAERAAAEPHVRPMEMKGRQMKGFVLVAPEATADETELTRWIDAGADHAASLPPKSA